MNTRASCIPRRLFSVSLFALGFGACDSDEAPAVDKPAVAANDEAKAGGDAKSADADKPAEPAKPAEPVKYCGDAECPCAPDSIKKHYESEEMSKCKITKEVDIQGYPIKADSDVTFNKEGRLMSFYPGKETKLGDYTAKAGAGVYLRADGSPKSFYVEASVDIGGISCTAGIALFEGGKLRRCKLAADTELSGLGAKKDDWVTLDEGGKLHRWEINGGRTEEISGIKCSGYMNYVHPDGSLLRCGLVEDIEVDGKKFEKKELVCFDPAGKVADCKGFKFDVGAG